LLPILFARNHDGKELDSMQRSFRHRHELRCVIGEVAGAYDHRGWSLFERSGSSDPRFSQYVSVHESLHEGLSASTAYGSILNIYADLAFHDVQRYRWLYDSLEDRARTTHECYATYVALLVLSQGRPDGIVSPSDDYFSYLQLATRLVGGTKSLYLQYHALTALARICMQTDCIETILSKGLERFCPADLEVRSYPDARLKLLLPVATASFWDTAFDEATASARGLAGWEMLQAACSGTDSQHLSLPEENDPLSHHLMEFLYGFLATELRKQGVNSLTFNGHQIYTKRLIVAGEEVVPLTSRKAPPLRAISTESDEEVLLSSFERERLVLLQNPVAASFSYLADVPRHRWRELVAGSGDGEHVFIVSRLPDRLLQQHKFPSLTEDLLKAQCREPLIALRRSAVANGDRFVDYFVVQEPDELDSLIAHFQGHIPLVANLSFATMTMDSFVSRWLGRLQALGQVSFLFDRYPFAHFKAWAQDGTFDVVYTTITCNIDGAVRSAFACQPQIGQSPIFLLPCSEAYCAALNYFVQTVLGSSDRFRSELSFLGPEASSLNITMGHLFREEASFDCEANVEQ
jgi:hypothetical protein